MQNSQRKVKILTKNKYLLQKLYLELCSEGEFALVNEGEEFTLCDIDTEAAESGALLLSYKNKSADVVLPQRIGKIRELLLAKKQSALALDENGKCVILFGKKIKLTEIEYSLFSLLYKKADFVSRQEILDTVWHGAKDAGIINVYIHYLREKLERDGEKIILSSRKLGYGISKKFLGGGLND